MNRAWVAAAISTIAILGACGGGGGNTTTNGTGGQGTGGKGTGGTGHGGAAHDTGGGGQGGAATTGSGTGTGGATTSSSSSGGGTTLDQACADLAAARCQRLNACSNGALITARWGDMGTCVTRNTLACKDAAAAPSSGTTVAGLAACAAALPGETCADFFDNNPVDACKVQPGTLANGAGCAFGAQCQSAFCLVPKGQACGTCQNEPAPGAACMSAGECGTHQTCSKQNVCETYLALNAPCAKGATCEAGLACVGATNQTMGKCMVQVTTVGATCDATKSTGADCDRNLGLTCNGTSMKCAMVAYDAGGQPCGAVNGAITGCSGGGACIIMTPPTGTCSAPAAEGAACDETAGPPCLSPARCVGGVCKLPDGAACP